MTLLLTPGEPAGIGPDITVLAAQKQWPTPLIVLADPDLLNERAHQLNLPITLHEINQLSELTPAAAKNLYVLPFKLAEAVIPGKLNEKNSTYVIDSLTHAARLCLQGVAQGIVTGPVHKAILNQVGYEFPGHTEFLATLSAVKTTVMLFVIPQLKLPKLALVTTHLPLRQVPSAITEAKLHAVIEVLHHGLQNQFGIEKPRILVCGLNPHAGESGLLGNEEIDTISPTLNKLQNAGYDVNGPYPADTIFTEKFLAKADVILAMYHDQGLPLIKYLAFDQAVNVTLGLPFVRTSVDHGTALDLAGTGKANPGSLFAALSLGMQLTNV